VSAVDSYSEEAHISTGHYDLDHPHSLARPWQSESTKRYETDQFGKKMYSQTEEADRKVVDRLAQVAGERGVPHAQVALAWLLSKPAIASPIVGATKPHHLQESTWGSNITALARNVWGRRSWRPHHTTPASFDILKLRIIRAERGLPPSVEVLLHGLELLISQFQRGLAEQQVEWRVC